MTEADTSEPTSEAKPKRERSDEQKRVLEEARIKALEVRKANAELRRKERDLEKRRKEADLEARRKAVEEAERAMQPEAKAKPPEPEPAEPPKKEPEPEPEEEEEEEEIVVVKKRKPKKKVKKIVYVSATDTDDDEVATIRHTKPPPRERSPPQRPQPSANYFQVFGNYL